MRTMRPTGDGDGRGEDVMATALLVGGRVILIAGTIAVPVCRLTKPLWRSAPLAAGALPDHWIPNSTFALSFLLALLLPLLVLPVGPADLAVRMGSDVGVRTVLGLRKVSVPSLRGVGVVLPSFNWDTHLLVLRDARHRVVIVWLELDGPDWIHRECPELEGKHLVSGDRATWGRRALRRGIGWLVVMAFGAGAFALFVLLCLLAGLV